MEATKISQQAIEDALDSQGGNWDYEDIRSYSGRGMYGEECLGIVFNDSRDAYGFFVELAAEDYDTAELLARKAREDSMGTSVIVYFPGVQVDD
jgi:hypothetical protein